MGPRSKAAIVLAILLCCGAGIGTTRPALSRGRSPAPLLLVESTGSRAGEARIHAVGDAGRVGFERSAVTWECLDAAGERVLVRIDFPMSPGAVILGTTLAKDAAASADPRERRTAYDELRYREIAPGADLVFHARDARLAAEIRLAPGARLSTVRMRLRGAKALAIDDAGALEVHGAAAVARIARPTLSQGAGGEAASITGGFKVIGQNELGFWCGDHDPALPLVVEIRIPIDP